MGYAQLMLIVLVAAVCVILLIVGFLAPRFSRRAEAGIDSDAERAERRASHAPGPLEGPLEKAAGLTEKAADKSSEAGRAARDRLGR